MTSQPPKVLIVEDDVDTATSLGELLDLWSYRVSVVFNGTDALQAAHDFKPDVVLLDIAMPDMDGYEVARNLRDEHSLARIMIVALTGYGQEKDRLLAKKVGFDHYLVKPVDLNALRTLLTSAHT